MKLSAKVIEAAARAIERVASSNFTHVSFKNANWHREAEAALLAALEAMKAEGNAKEALFITVKDPAWPDGPDIWNAGTAGFPGNAYNPERCYIIRTEQT